MQAIRKAVKSYAVKREERKKALLKERQRQEIRKSAAILLKHSDVFQIGTVSCIAACTSLGLASRENQVTTQTIVSDTLKNILLLHTINPVHRP